jgi:hypothetical protein
MVEEIIQHFDVTVYNSLKRLGIFKHVSFNEMPEHPSHDFFGERNLSGHKTKMIVECFGLKA